MKSKKAIFSLLLILISVIIYIVLYNKTYQIKVNANEVYEIEIQTCDKLGFKKDNGAEFKYQYNILNGYINIGSFRYKIISK